MMMMMSWVMVGDGGEVMAVRVMAMRAMVIGAMVSLGGRARARARVCAPPFYLSRANACGSSPSP